MLLDIDIIPLYDLLLHTSCFAQNKFDYYGCIYYKTFKQKVITNVPFRKKHLNDLMFKYLVDKSYNKTIGIKCG